jgi:glycosyltransferase involved in cell wall biosynthesis
MISVVIATRDSERPLVPTLAALVQGALTGIVREVIVTDGGSRDATAAVADVAGCQFVVTSEPVGGRLSAAARAARSPWLLFLQPGTVPDSIWTEETSRFVEQAELAGRADALAAVFRPAAAVGGRRPIVVEALALFRVALGGLPRPSQGLLISKRFYDRLGGHRTDRADPERDLLRRIGRRRLVMMRSGAVNVGD